MKEKNEYDEKTEKFLKDCGAKMRIVKIGVSFGFPNYDQDTRPRYRYRVKITRKGFGQYSFYFFGSHADYMENVKEERPYSVLAALTKYELGSFNGFCVAYGFSDLPLSHYPRIKRIYDACKKEYENVVRIFGDVLEELREIN